MELTNHNDYAGINKSTDATDADFRRSLCNKTYSRRDLRNRHRRRCVKTCAQKKLRCSLTCPICTRCVQMDNRCRYPNSSSTAGHQDTGPESIMSIEVTPKPTPTALNTNIPVSAATLPIDGSNSASSMYKMAWGPELNNAGFMLRLLGHGSGFPGQGQWPESESGFVGDHVLNLSLSFFLALQEKSKLPQIPDISSVLVSGDTLAAPQTPISSSLGSTHNEPFTGPDAADISLSSGS